ncbi:FKBP-type peptidyl-prolyl cis-trans isomerase [Pseudomonas indica]|jgi:FKBP-type peptidyl-prolyl cis-trans isomerase|uniref:Peptidyl-prolyl cis-trans isomerase n=1 Tax=Pseudomonas indica TaxID=137658 RepID=A0A1G8T9D2_9PSED|nr:FKBP-type peptidyl-prolyl cis-trans isomerase [Pseudomonas indica]SDJ38249.1 peptidylprolyl isomerase/FKBP-type peptidyl-prolyl cis-trans isomerase FklB [Pseudomonas indica]
MSRYPALLLCLFAATLQAEESPPTEDRDLAYSLGVRLGERLREEVPDLQLDALLEGVRQAYRGEPLRLDPARIDALLADHEARLLSEAPLDVERARAAEGRFLAREKAKAGIRELPGGVLVETLRPGRGTVSSSWNRVQVRYVGRLADGSVFDENKEAQWFRLDSVIAGWRTALREMPLGATWRLVIPSSQAYGAEGAGDLIPPYAPLVFEVELLNAE